MRRVVRNSRELVNAGRKASSLCRRPRFAFRGVLVPMVREIRDYARLGVGGYGRFRVTDQKDSIGDKSSTEEMVPRNGPSRARTICLRWRPRRGSFER